MAFGNRGKYFYPCLLKENNFIFLDGSKKQKNDKNVLECLLPPIGTPVWAQGKDGDYLEKGEVVAVDMKRRRVKVSQDGLIEWIHQDQLAIQEKEIKKIRRQSPRHIRGERVKEEKIKWTKEVSTIKTAFGHLLMKGLLPGYSQIESLHNKKNCLQRRSKSQIMSKCHQLINKEY